MEVLVLSGSLASLWAASFRLFACLDFGPCPLFLFLSLSWVLSFYEVQNYRWCKNKKNKRSLTSRPLKKVQCYQITLKEAEEMKTRQKKILKSKKH